MAEDGPDLVIERIALALANAGFITAADDKERVDTPLVKLAIKQT